MNDQQKEPQAPDVSKLKEPHLLDFSSVADVAQWIALLLLGLLGDVAYDMTKDAVRDMLESIKRRFGRRRLGELEAKVIELVDDVKGQ